MVDQPRGELTAIAAEGTVASLRGVSRVYGATRALDGVDIDIRGGEIHALLGANGAGKSTLVKIIAGMTAPSSGSMVLRGKQVTFRSVRDSMAANVRVVHQELSVFPNLTVAQNLVVGRRRSAGAREALRREYQALFDEWGIPLLWDVVARELSPVAQATVSLAKSLVGEADLLILDEPTAALSSREVDGLFRIVRRKAAEGTAVVFVSHRLREVAELCDVVTVLRNGRVVHRGVIADTDQDQLAELIAAGHASTSGNAAPTAPRALVRDRVGAVAGPALRVEGMQVGRRVSDATFVVHPGEILGIAGLVGAGRTEVLEAIVGHRRMTAGRIQFDGKDYRPRDPDDALRRGIALVPEERAAQALFAQHDIGFNFAASRFRREGIGWGGMIASRRRNDATSRTLAGELQLKYGGLRARITSLSGGNQQKVVLGRSLLPQLKLLLLDEPTRGVDIGARREFETIIRGLADRGVSVIYVASELAELAQCDRIVVMVEGRTTIEGPAGPDFDEDELTRLTFIPRNPEDVNGPAVSRAGGTGGSR